MNLVKNINPYIFRGYDLRGVYPTDLNADVAYTIGKSYGSYLQDLGFQKCVIGYDNRFSSPELTDALIKGITETGADVVDIGLVTTPIYYYACLYYQIPSGIMVTASHNPKDDNGFKIAFQNYDNACGDLIQDFRKYTEKLEFREGQGNIEKRDILPAYYELIKNSIKLGERRIRAIVDCGNGTTSLFIHRVMEMFPIDVTYLYADSDPNFPNHHPDPSVEKNLTVLKEKVIAEKADVGIAYDGDGDRVGIVDEQGNLIYIDLFMIMIWRDIMPKISNKGALYDVKCSKSLEDEIIRLGGQSICYRTGNSYVKNRIKELDLAFGGELSGHVFFRDRFPGFDDGIYAGLRLIEILSKTNQKVSELLDGITHYYASPELKFASPDDRKFQVIDEVKKYCQEKGYKINTIDGVRAEFTDGWALVRASNTGPTITSRFEGITEARCQELQEEFVSLITKLTK